MHLQHIGSNSIEHHGILPVWHHISSLRLLIVEQCGISGSLPWSQLGFMTALTELNLGYIMTSWLEPFQSPLGTWSTCFLFRWMAPTFGVHCQWKLPIELVILPFSQSQKIHFPDQFRLLPLDISLNLQQLHLQYNKFLSGSIAVISRLCERQTTDNQFVLETDCAPKNHRLF